jgi:HK97 family phage major capsid protein
MMNDASVKVIRKIKDGNGRPIFVPGYEHGQPRRRAGPPAGPPDLINQDVAGHGREREVDPLRRRSSKYKIRDVMDLTLFRMTDSAFTLNGQVGFVAFMRSGGNLIDVGGVDDQVLPEQRDRVTWTITGTTPSFTFSVIGEGT